MAGQHGGRRPGAGRKPGSASRRTREIAEKAAEHGITPLEVMLEAMREAYAKRDLDAAARFAKEAAPYCHARFSAVEHTGNDGGPVKIVIGADDAAV
jgi:hypothetical protein